jgi:ATP-dependent exoDNAse (exonuclease V) alpha subunit
MLDELPGKQYTYNAKRTGYLKLVGENLPAPEELNLKVGARVMIKKNIIGAVNGSLGTITKCDAESVDVELDTGETIGIAPETWKSYRYSYNTDNNSVEAVVVGKYTQLPVMLGYAVTVHKSQSLTLDSVEIDAGRGMFSHGHCYVALSRCRKMETLKLTIPLEKKDIIIDDRVIEFHNEMFGEV